VNNTGDMLNLRWRAAQWLLALSDGDIKQRHALREAMRIEGLDQADILDELALLRGQFAGRKAWHLRQEIDRVARKLGVAR